MAQKRKVLIAVAGLIVACFGVVAILEMINEYQDQSPSPTPPLPTAEGDAEKITLALAGDVMLARLVNESIRANGPLYPWGDVLPLVREADFR